MTKSEIIKAAKAHGLFITENSNADFAAKSLLEANKRITRLELIIDMPAGERRDYATNDYKKKYLQKK